MAQILPLSIIKLALDTSTIRSTINYLFISFFAIFYYTWPQAFHNIPAKKMPTDLFLTVKVNNNFFAPQELKIIYEAYLYTMRSYLKVVYMVYELDSKDKLHLHAHIRCNKKMPYKTLHFPPLHVYVKPINNLQGLYKYLNKHPYEVVPRFIQSAESMLEAQGFPLLHSFDEVDNL